MVKPWLRHCQAGVINIPRRTHWCLTQHKPCFGSSLVKENKEGLINIPRRTHWCLTQRKPCFGPSLVKENKEGLSGKPCFDTVSHWLATSALANRLRSVELFDQRNALQTHVSDWLYFHVKHRYYLHRWRETCLFES